MNEKSGNGRRAIFDVVKFLLSLMIVAIHSALLPTILYPWLRLAVPLFFVISSYFFFEKTQKALCKQEEVAILKHFVIRNLRLYLFWFVVLLPYTLYSRRYFEAGIIRGMIVMVKSFFFASTFPASWFIQALIVGVVIVFFVSRKPGRVLLPILAGMAYLFAIIRSSYWSVAKAIPFAREIRYYYSLLFSEPMFNAAASLIWIVMGKYFSEHKSQMKKSVLGLGLALSATLLYAEWWFVRGLNGTYNNDCYLFLVPTVFFVFQAVQNIYLPVNNVTCFLGKCSILIYTTHIPAIALIGAVCRRFLGINNAFLVFAVVVVLCMLGSMLVLKAEKNRFFKWLKYAH